jgi:tripartite-type tricarboxylate transporter receptor subunit TctC
MPRLLPRQQIHHCLWFLTILLLAAADGHANAQTFPTKAVHIVVPFAAGGALDSLTRVLAEELQGQWRQAVVVENRVGASGNIGTESVAHSDADGHTLLASPPPPLALNQFLFKTLPFRPADFSIITILASAPNVLVANRRVPASNLSELIALAKPSPGKFTYASTGKGGTPHLTMEWLKLAARIDMVHIPYPKGYAPALTDLIAGHVDLMFANLSDAKRLIDGGELKAIAVASNGPVNDLRGVMPVSQNFPELISQTWMALAAPRGLPPSIADKIVADVGVAMRAPSMVGRLKTLSLTSVVNSPAEAAILVEQDARRWQKVVNMIGLRPE